MTSFHENYDKLTLTYVMTKVMASLLAKEKKLPWLIFPLIFDRIVAAQLSDSNTYRCLASNNLGKSFVEVNLTIVGM